MRRSQVRSASLAILWAASMPVPAIGGPPMAPDARVAVAFGNTVETTYPDGRTQKVWLRADGTWTGLSRRHKRLAGQWNQKGDKICLRQRTPPTLPIRYCAPFPKDARVGAAWTSKDIMGTPIQLRLMSGVLAGIDGAGPQAARSDPPGA